jgi:20S proteasome alpha/beta subunit
MFCVGSGAQFAYAVLDTVEPPLLGADKVASPIDDGASVESTLTSTDVASSGDSPYPGTRVHADTLLSRLPLQVAIDTAVKAVRHATFRDGYSGGYINVLVVNATGIHHVKRVDSKTIPM